MNPKRIIIVGTLAIFITIGGAIRSDEANANFSMDPEAIKLAHRSKPAASGDLSRVLGLSPDKIYDALYNGKSLAEIAKDNQVDVQNIIELQVAELTEQLDMRLAKGSITPTQYHLQKSELTDIITKSTYLKMS